LDCVTSADHPRASNFSYISSTSYVISFLGPTLASFTMSKSVWLPFWINIVLLTFAVPVIAMLPRTTTKSTSRIEHNNLEDVDEIGPLLGEDPVDQHIYSNAFERRHGVLQNIMHTVYKLISLIKGRRNFQVLLCSFFLTALASSDTKLLVQYISKRYEWTFAEVGLCCHVAAAYTDCLTRRVISSRQRPLSTSRCWP
jgi:MFS family permease